MLRKFIVIFLAVCMVSTSFVFAGATSMPSEYEESFFDALSYNNLSTVHAGNVGNGVGTFQLPNYMNMEYIDIIFHCLTFSSVGFGFNGTVRTNLTFVSLGSGYYRAFGAVDLSANRFDIIFSSPANYIYLDRVHIYSSQLLENQIAGGATIVAPGFSGTSISYNPTDNTNRRTWTGAAYSGTNTVSLQFHPTVDNWKGYDYLDYLIYLKLNSISSISCFFDGKAVPFEISEIFTGLDEDNVYLVNVRIDCRSLDRSLSQYPILQIHGFEYPNDTNVVDIYSISGLTYITNSFSFNYFFTRIWSSLTSGFNSLSSGIGSISTWIQTQTTSIVNAISSGFTSVGTWIQNQTTTIVNNFTSLKTSLTGWFNSLFDDLAAIKESLSGTAEDEQEIQDNLDSAKQEMDDFKDSVDSMPVPDVDDLDVDLDNVSGDAEIISVGQVLAIGINNSVILPAFTLLFTLAMVGYALYGKR